MSSKPKKPDYKQITERNVTRVITLELALPAGECEDALDALEVFLENHVRTVGAGEIINNRLVAGNMDATYETMMMRRDFYAKLDA